MLEVGVCRGPLHSLAFGSFIFVQDHTPTGCCSHLASRYLALQLFSCFLHAHLLLESDNTCSRELGLVKDSHVYGSHGR